ncbi:(2Fe-2S)-binding protein [Erythrobacter mangrovi]|uniref:(2Fe-2S)-binding protein n=1 Tax=Erythrobacter mangrovi TaxID=2739433 RepID=A0A7D3XSS2_9SPHN|nr:(2Fe-2S)-binding protein [Erythrobacter mangrovi]
MPNTAVTLTIDGVERTASVEPRDLLVLALREKFGATAPHVGCESGRCGACTVLLDGTPVKSCMMLAVQVNGSEVTTAAGLGPHRIGSALQAAFKAAHGLQCGYCTPGMLASASGLLAKNPNPNEDEVRQALRGNLCRCTGYQHILDAVLLAAENLREAEPA